MLVIFFSIQVDFLKKKKKELASGIASDTVYEAMSSLLVVT